jgi:hypothetical protein
MAIYTYISKLCDWLLDDNKRKNVDIDQLFAWGRNITPLIKTDVKSIRRIRSAQAYIPMVGTRPLECY